MAPDVSNEHQDTADLPTPAMADAADDEDDKSKVLPSTPAIPGAPVERPKKRRRTGTYSSP